MNRPNISSRQVQICALVVIALAIAQGIAQVRSVLQPTELIVGRLTCDDTFYYLETAWNLRHLGFSTFDGQNPTNGVQPLWFLLLYAISFLASDKEGYLRLALLLSALLNVLCYLPIWLIGRRLQRPLLAVLMAACWWYFNTQLTILLLGMEASLHACLFWGMLAALCSILREGDEPSRRQMIWLAAWSSLLVWTRIDSVILVVPLYAYLVWRMRSRGVAAVARAVWPSMLVAGTAAVLLLVTFQSLGGSWLPVSGMVKQHSASWGSNSAKVAALLLARGAAAFPPIDVWRNLPGTGIRAALSGVVLLGCCLGGAIAVWRIEFGDRSVGRRFFVALLILLAATLVQIAYWSGLGRRALYAVWYQGPWYVLATVILCVLFGAILEWLWSTSRLGRATSIALGLLFGVATFASLGRGVATETHQFPIERVRVAHWMSEHLEPDAICAAWNAGELGYFSDRRVVNLDGLINSPDYFRDVLAGSKSLDAYLQEQRVRYVVDYGLPAKIAPHPRLSQSSLLKGFPIPGDERVIEIRRLP